MTLTPEEREIEAAAKHKLLPKGPWHREMLELAPGTMTIGVGSKELPVCICHGIVESPRGNAIATYVAIASPQNVLGLLEQIRALRTELHDVRGDLAERVTESDELESALRAERQRADAAEADRARRDTEREYFASAIDKAPACLAIAKRKLESADMCHAFGIDIPTEVLRLLVEHSVRADAEKARADNLEAELASLRAFRRGVEEALNSGDGSYRP